MKKMVVHFNREVCDVYIGRPSRFGNPFQLGPNGDRAEVLLRYELWLQSRPDLIEEVCRVLPDRVLGCWCDDSFRCHGEILAAIANGARLALPLILDDKGMEE